MVEPRSDQAAARLRVGLIVNPIAGMGGSVGLKGTDGTDVLRQAVALGAQPQSTARTARTLHVLNSMADRVRLLVAPGAMGSDVAQPGFDCECVATHTGKESAAADTREAALAMKEAGASLILFAGGDGTARDLLEAIGAAVPLIGIPCGVKMYSGVFATSPEAAGHLVRAFADGHCETEPVEIMDIDEQAYRAGQITAQIFGYACCPRAGNRLQGPKARSALPGDAGVRAAATELAETMQPGPVYLVGPGTSANAVLDAMELTGTLLGVDAVREKKVVGRDLSADDVRRITAENPVRLVLGVIGGQGYILGRGNQQIPPDLIRRAGRDGLLVLASEEKLAQLAGGRLLVDTGDPVLDRELEGFIRVHTGAGRRMMMTLSAGH